MATAVVYSPDGNGIVVNEANVQDWLAKGYITEADYIAQEKVLVAQQYQEWLNSTDTMDERFRMLRMARDGRISATDYLMTADYPISESSKTMVMAYREALRNLPAQSGAPWDGGGNLTPWPEMPTIIKTTN